MPLSIKSIEAERLAREVAAKTGESLTEAIQKPWKSAWLVSSSSEGVKFSPVS